MGDVYLIKTDSQGNKLWERTFGGRDSEAGYSVQETRDGGYIIAGDVTSFMAGKAAVYLVKTDSRGNKLWDRTIGGWDWTSGRSVQETRDSGYIIVGYTASFAVRNQSVYLVKTDSQGNKLWENTFCGEYPGANIWASGASVQETRDGGYIIVGGIGAFNSSGVGPGEVYLIKTDSQGLVSKGGYF